MPLLHKGGVGCLCFLKGALLAYNRAYNRAYNGAFGIFSCSLSTAWPMCFLFTYCYLSSKYWFSYHKASVNVVPLIHIYKNA